MLEKLRGALQMKMTDLRYSEVLLKGKNKTLVKILGVSSTQDDPCRSNIGGGSRDPCGVDAYENQAGGEDY